MLIIIVVLSWEFRVINEKGIIFMVKFRYEGIKRLREIVR